MHRLAGLAIAAVLISFSGAAMAQALLYVIESTTPSVKVGTAYGPTDRVNVPSGNSVRIVLPSGKTHTIKGPYNGTLSDLAQGEAPNDSVMAWLKNLLQTGGSNERTPGATRSVRPMPAAPQYFSWTAIPIDADGTICVQKGARLELQRRSQRSAEQVTIVDEASARRGVTEFYVGRTNAPWPEGVVVLPDMRYVLALDSGVSRRLTLRVLEKLPNETDILKELATRGCRYQFDAWVREKIGKTTAR